MDFTNINDPAGVKALLDQLRTSWEELDNSPPLPPGMDSASHVAETRRSPPPPLPAVSEAELEISPFVSDLLLRLQSPGSGTSSIDLSRMVQHVDASHQIKQQPAFTSISSSPPEADGSTPTTSQISFPRPKHSRSLNFIQALPVIARLSEDPVFMEKLDKIQEQQTCLERKLWEERSRILKAQEERVKIAQAKAAIVGGGLSQHDASSLRNSFQKELRAFDREHILPAWDVLVAKQQATLEVLGVPGMFVTTLKADREKQHRIVQVLDGLTRTEDDDVEL